MVRSPDIPRIRSARGCASRYHQRGCLRSTARKSGPARWEFLWRENTPERKRVRRTAVIGTVEKAPNATFAAKA
jgi:hypothetical protein